MLSLFLPLTNAHVCACRAPAVQEGISTILFLEGGAEAIVNTMRAHDFNSALLRSGMDALGNIANDIETTVKMAEALGLVQLVLGIMKSNDWDVELIGHAVPLLATITCARLRARVLRADAPPPPATCAHAPPALRRYAAPTIQLIVELDGIPVLLAAMDAHSRSHELLASAQLALTNLAVDERVRMVFKNMNGVKTLLRLMEKNITVKEYVNEVMATLTRFCGDDELSSQIAEEGMAIIVRATIDSADDPEFLTSAFRLVGHLAFVPTNLRVIVQYNGIGVVLQAMSAHPSHRALMVRSIQTVDNIAMASREYAHMVIQEGGREMINEIMAAYEDDDEIQRYGKSAVLSMSALENLSMSAEVSKKAATAPKKEKKKEEEKEVDPLAQYRHMLAAGSVLNVWTKGDKRSAHVLVAPDWRSVVWQDPKTGKKLGAMDLRAAVAVRTGLQEGHKKKGMGIGKGADPDLAFSIMGERVSVDMEANVKPDVVKWFKALSALLHVFKTNPAAL